MTGWRLAVAIVAAFGGGYLVKSWFAAELIERLQGTVVALKACQEHTPCLEIIGRQQAEVENLRWYADYLERQRDGRGDLDAGLDQILRRDGGS